MRSSDGADWTFLDDPRFVKAIDNAARMYVSTFEGRYANKSMSHTCTVDEAYNEARQMAVLYLAERKWLVEQTLEDNQWGWLAERIYRHGVYDRRRSEIRRRSIESGSSFSGVAVPIIVASRLKKSKVPVDYSRYTEEKVRRLATLCWHPWMLDSSKDPFSEDRPHDDDPFWRKATTDPSHRFTDVAEMADMRSAFHWIEGDKYHNPAGLTKPEIRALYTVCVEDMTFRSAALSSSMGKSSIHESLDKALSKLVTYMNNPKGRCDDE